MIIKKIDVSTWNRKQVYEHFKTFSNPCYGFDVEMDITDVYKIGKETNTKFFINFVYLLTLALNDIDALKLRIKDGEIVLYDVVHPTYTIENINGTFCNGGNLLVKDYKTFYEAARKELDDQKNLRVNLESYNHWDYDVFYYTCIPWLKVESMIHPMPDKDLSGQCVPRVCWSKYYEKDGRMKMMLNITVSHILCDGHDLSNAFIKVQEYLDNARIYLK